MNLNAGGQNHFHDNILQLPGDEKTIKNLKLESLVTQQ
jgi:hypothetical protein